MKALTVFNPFPAYMFLPADDPLRKRVENRGKTFHYRGELLIHAGTSKAMMDPDESYEGLEFHWGCIVGIVTMVDCVALQYQDMLELYSVPVPTKQKYPWLATHPHAHGPNCLILENPRKFPEPVKCRGAQGLWNVTGVPLVNVKQQLKEAIAV